MVELYFFLFLEGHVPTKYCTVSSQDIKHHGEQNEIYYTHIYLFE